MNECPSKKILITGGAGFIGQHCARLGAYLGYEVHILDLPEKLKNQSFPWFTHACDILDFKALTHTMIGIDYVIHAAANPQLWHPSKKQVMAINTQGTDYVVRAAHACDVKRLVYVSTDCTLISKHHTTLCEDNQTSYEDMIGTYCQSKWLAEKRILQANTHDLETLIVHPGVPVGPTQQNAPFVQMLKAYLEGRIKGYIDGHIGLVCVEDVAQCVFRALEQGHAKNRYLAVSELWGLHDLFVALSQICAIKAPWLKVPYSVAYLAAFFQEMLADWTQRPPLSTRSGLNIALYAQHLNHHKTEDALEFKFRPCQPGLEAMVLNLMQAHSDRLKPAIKS